MNQGTPTHRPTIHYVEAQVDRTPEAIAVRFPADGGGEDTCLSYGELDRRANGLAHWLQARGVGPEVSVGLFMERSLELVVGVLGILKAGGAYVALDPAHPQERLAFMLEDSGAAVVLTQARLRDQLPDCRAEVVCLDAAWESVAPECPLGPEYRATNQNLLAIMYTSGSTGRPKAVMRLSEHLADPRCERETSRPFGPQDRQLLKASLGTIAFNNELFRPLTNGGELIIVPADRQLDPSYLVRLIARYEVTILDVVPSFLRLLLDEPGFAACDSLDMIFSSGEALSVSLQERLFSQADVLLLASYGTTEAPGAAFWKSRRGQLHPVTHIGRRLSRRAVYILDSQLQPVLTGATGEFYIGGRLARGYLNRPDLTAERFVPDPFSETPGTRMYRTGDLGRCLEDETLEYLGRGDDQVQVRGFRVEPGEVQVALSQHPAVGAAVVLARDAAHEPGEKCLVAYVVPNRKPAPTARDLRGFLQQKLPEYMVPSAFVLLDTLPLMPGGKVDRSALLAPEQVRAESAFAAPRDPVEEALAGIWAEVLGLERVGVHDDFFELGGNSMLAVQVISRIRTVLNADVSVRHLFDTLTVAELAQVVEKARGRGQPGVVPVSREAYRRRRPVSGEAP